MSTHRYSGDVRIRVTCREGIFRNGHYRCYLTAPGGAKATIVVGAPEHLSQAVDSPRAFDDAAKASLAFAAHEPESDVDWDAFASWDGNGYYVSRQAATVRS